MRIYVNPLTRTACKPHSLPPWEEESSQVLIQRDRSPPPQVKDRVTARPRHLTPGLEGLMADDNGAKGGAGEALVAHTQ